MQMSLFMLNALHYWERWQPDHSHLWNGYWQGTSTDYLGKMTMTIRFMGCPTINPFAITWQFPLRSWHLICISPHSTCVPSTDVNLGPQCPSVWSHSIREELPPEGAVWPKMSIDWEGIPTGVYIWTPITLAWQPFHWPQGSTQPQKNHKTHPVRPRVFKHCITSARGKHNCATVFIFFFFSLNMSCPTQERNQLLFGWAEQVCHLSENMPVSLIAH